MSDSGGWGNVVLPSSQPSLGEVMQQGNNMRERQFERQASLLIHDRDKKETEGRRNQLYNLNQIGDAADEKQYQTGEQAVDAYAHNFLQGIQDWSMQNAIDKDPSVAKQMISQKMRPFLAWHGNIKNAIKTANAGLGEFNKTYPNANAVKAHNMVMDNIANEYMAKGEDGSWQPKPVEFIKPRDFVSDLQDPKNLGSLIDDTTPFSDYMHSQEKQNLSDADVSNIKGYGKKVKWSVVKTPLHDMTPDKQGLPTLDVKHTTMTGVKDADGQPMKFADETIINDMRTKPKVWGSALAMWDQEKQGIEAKTGKPMDKSEEEYRFRNMVYKNLKQFLPSGIKVEQQQIVPKPPKITVNVGNGKDVPVHDAYAEITSKAEAKPHGIPLNELSPASQSSILTIARGVTGNTFLGQRNIFVGKAPDGSIHIADAKTGQSIAPINPTDINLTANKSLGVKTKQKIVAQGNSNQPAPKKTKTDRLGLGL